MTFELISSVLIALNISLLIYVIARVAYRTYISRSRSELGIKNFDDTRTTKKKEQGKRTLEIIIYLIGVVGGLLMGSNLTPFMFGSGIFFLLFAATLYAILKSSR